MDDNKSLSDKIAYQEIMLKAYDDMRYKEESYRSTLKREKEKNRKKFKQYIILGSFLFTIDMFALFMTRGGFINKNPEGDSAVLFTNGVGIIMSMFGMMLLTFAGIASVFCAYKLIYYGRRFNKEQDNRDFVWRTYKEMEEISDTAIADNITGRVKTAADLEATKQMLEEQLSQQRIGYEEKGEEPEAISMSELFYVKESFKESLPDNRNALEKKW